MIKEGGWQVYSEIDPRWNLSGSCIGDAFCVPGMEKWIERCKKEYGEPPEDVTMSFMKY